MKTWKQVAGLGPSGWFDLARAGLELALARRFIGGRTVSDLLRHADGRRTSVSDSLSADQRRLVDRVAYAVPRVAVRVPWRADCLVQALAAQHWLQRKGIPTTLHFGVHKDVPSELEAHAWLMQGDTIVTGGDIARYTPLRAERHA